MARSTRLRGQWLGQSIVAAALVGSLVWSPTAMGQVRTRSPVRITIQRAAVGPIRKGPDTSPDGLTRVMADRLSIRLVEARTGRPIGPPLRPAGVGEVTTWAFSPDGRFFAAGNGGPRGRDGFGVDGGIRVWEVATGRIVAEREATALVSGLDFNPRGDAVVAVADPIDGP